jgi:hypothetical protein
MSDRHNLVRDVIYGLKREYGEEAVLTREASTFDPTTGKNIFTRYTQYIPLAIPLPMTLRQQFLKTLGVHKAGFLESGVSEVLIDAEDLDIKPKPQWQIRFGSKDADIVTVEDYGEALLLTTKEVTNRPIRVDVTETVTFNEAN